MNWYKTFYWVTRADSVKDFFDSASNWFLFFTLISAIAYIVCSFNLANTISENGTTTPDEDAKDSGVRAWKMARRYSAGLFYPMLGLLLITWSLWVFVPTKKEAILIMAAGGTMNFLTTDSSARQIPHEMTTFVVSELKSMAKDAQVDLGISSQKDKILEEAKKMTTEELLEKMKADSNFAKIITDR